VRRPPNVAVLGADDPLGEAVLRHLTERDIELGEVFPLTLSESDGCATVRGEELPLIEALEFDWARADILISLARSPAAEQLERIAGQVGCRVAGFGQLAGHAGRAALDGALAIALQRVLAPVGQMAGLASVNVTALLPVAAAGEAGVAELASQTRALFSMEPVEPEVFPLQIAFNLIPQVGAMQPDGSGRLELDAVAELRRLLDSPDLPVSVTALWAPLFYGAEVIVHARAATPVDVAQVRERLARHPGITLMDTGLPGGVATPATDAQDSDAVFVSRLRPGADAQHDITLALVIDMLRLEAASVVDWLENSIERQAGSMLT
jgi:aspartate-semialdehyde dehydrogenase